MSDNNVVSNQTVFEPAVYWKLKSQLLEIAIKEREVQEIFRACGTARSAVLEQAGLNPSVTYQLVDEQLSAVAFPGTGPSKE